MTPVTAAKVKYGVWGLIGGAIIAMIIGFVWGGGWTTTRTTEAGRRGGLGGAGGDLRRSIHATTEPTRKLQALEKSILTIALTSLKKKAGTKCPGKNRGTLLCARMRRQA